jgi:undecaprenyl-diphosphatase
MRVKGGFFMLDRFLQLDGQLLVAIQGLHVAWLDPVVSFYTKMGDAGILFIALSLAMLLYRPTRKAGALALGAMVLGLLVTNVTIKPLV